MDILGFFKQRKSRLDELADQRQRTHKPKGRIKLKSRIDEVLDPRSATPLFEDIPAVDPLNFPGYADKTAELMKHIGHADAFKCATGAIEGHKVVCTELIPEFLMGSMGTAVGEAVCRSAEYALEHRIPLIIFSASGGARMQEGMFSLMQMAKTSAAIRKLTDAGILYISILTHPTTGGVTASFASLGDIILAEPDALIGFAGPRVIEQTIGSTLPEGFQRSEFQQEHGFVDAIVSRDKLRGMLAHLLELHTAHEDQPGKVACRPELDSEPSDEIQQSSVTSSPCRPELDSEPSDEIQQSSVTSSPCRPELDSGPSDEAAGGLRVSDTNPAAESSNPTAPSRKTPAEHVEIARHPERPRTRFFIEHLFDGFIELHGDRLFRDDPALIGGLAFFEGMPITVAAHVKGSDLNENIAYNFGMPHPEGYRKFVRLAKQAEKFNRPLITLIDTPGAYPGAEAEERGQGEAIARCLFELSGLKVPVIAIITGEGGSGGALALGAADRVLMLEYAVYSVLSPEGFASILWKDSKRAREACDVMKLTAQDLYSFDMVDAIIEEPEDGAHTDADAVGTALRSTLRTVLNELRVKETDLLLSERYEKYRKFR